MFTVSHERRVMNGRDSAIRKGHKLWTDERNKQLTQMYLDGLPISEIARSLGRSYAAVRVQLLKLPVSPRRRVNFTHPEVSYIRRYYGVKTVESIAIHLGRTPKSIMAKAFSLGLGGRYFGSNHHFSKLSDHDVDLIRELHDEGLSIHSIARKMEVHPRAISNIVKYRCRLGLTFNSGI
ncbi:helix-turn-helix domain-containing protein [Vibrio harveyi]|uniref:helix-turn-helix domain-containing protein n=1 Tax=Vibrio harveyi TaxID=669 RepID=UPI003AADD55D